MIRAHILNTESALSAMSVAMIIINHIMMITKYPQKAGKGFCTKLDLGIVKYHFEVGSEKELFYKAYI